MLHQTQSSLAILNWNLLYQPRVSNKQNPNVFWPHQVNTPLLKYSKSRAVKQPFQQEFSLSHIRSVLTSCSSHSRAFPPIFFYFKDSFITLILQRTKGVTWDLSTKLIYFSKLLNWCVALCQGKNEQSSSSTCKCTKIKFFTRLCT